MRARLGQLVRQTGWRTELTWRRTFRDNAVEQAFQHHHQLTHTVRSKRKLFLLANIIWMGFIAETLTGEGSAFAKEMLIGARALSTVITVPYLIASFCTRLADHSVYEIGIPAAILMGLTLALQTLLLDNAEAASVPLGWMLLMPFTISILKSTIPQTVLLITFEVAAYLVCYFVARPTFYEGVPVIFALLATGMTSIAIAENLAVRERLFFWLMRKGHLTTDDFNQIKSPKTFARSLGDDVEAEITFLPPEINNITVETIAPPQRPRANSIVLAALPSPSDPSSPASSTPASHSPRPAWSATALPSIPRSPISASASISPATSSPPSNDGESPRPSRALRDRLRRLTALSTAHGLALGWSLAFREPRLEARCRHWMRREVHGDLSFMLIVMLCGEALFGISDYITSPENLWVLLGIRYGGTLPVFAVALLASRFKRLHTRLVTFLPFLVCLVGGTKFLTIALLPPNLPLNAERAFAGAVLRFTLHAHASFHLRFVGILLATTPWVTGTVAIQIAGGQSLLEPGFQVCAWMLALICSYIDERQVRAMFLLDVHVGNDSPGWGVRERPALATAVPTDVRDAKLVAPTPLAGERRVTPPVPAGLVHAVEPCEEIDNRLAPVRINIISNTPPLPTIRPPPPSPAARYRASPQLTAVSPMTPTVLSWRVD